MRIALAHLRSTSPYSQSKAISSEKSRDETHADYEKRCWKERAHVDKNGVCFIPPMAFKNCLSEAAKYKSEQIPGKGKATYTKHFEAGVLCIEPLSLGVKIDDVQEEKNFVPADGRRGGDKRVWKSFPIFHEWKGVVTFHVLDDLIDEEVFERHLRDAGSFIGIGRFRPRRNGYFGRFEVEKIEWT